MTEHELADRLQAYVPPKAAIYLAQWIREKGVHFRIARPRDSVYGDYMPPQAGKGHRISINGNQNKFSFLITAVHEFAHLHTWELHQERVKPHGQEWKHHFRILMEPLYLEKIFPADVENAVKQYLINPAASSCSDDHLMEVLKRYDRITKPFLKEVEEGERFFLQGKEYIRGPLRRTRYECRLAGTSHVYLISATAEIDLPVDSPGE